MKHKDDVTGLEKYLKDLGVMPENGALLSAEQCEQIRIGLKIDAGRKAKMSKLHKMSGQERFDLGYRALFPGR
ncbi:Uncharacterised protein [uncultured archaeon]|nr:Uncharacterised protein [uncultured archaeon]